MRNERNTHRGALALLAAGSLFLHACRSRNFSESRNKSEQPQAQVPQAQTVGLLGKAADDAYREPDEDANMKILEDLTETLMETNRAKPLANGDTRLRRDVHTKAHACLRGVFEVNPNISEDLSVGIFQPGAKFPVWARLSNGAPGGGPDKGPSSRGLAFKLLEVEETLKNRMPAGGESKWLLDDNGTNGQDFTFLNGRVFIISNLKTYVDFTRGVVKGDPMPSLKPFPPEEKAFLQTVMQPVTDPFAISYFGQVPYKWKDTAAKFRVDPCDMSGTAPASGPSEDPDSLAKSVKATLAQKNACFVLSVILQKDDSVQPIRNSNIEWLSDDKDIAANKNFANRTEVARLVFPKQDVDNEPNAGSCEGSKFNPWHSIAAHEPLGSMGRARKSIYRRGADTRGANPTTPTVTTQHKQMLESVSPYAR